MEELCKKDPNDPDNHDGVITHLEPDILECKVKWDLGSITMNILCFMLMTLRHVYSRGAKTKLLDISLTSSQFTGL